LIACKFLLSAHVRINKLQRSPAKLISNIVDLILEEGLIIRHKTTVCEFRGMVNRKAAGKAAIIVVLVVVILAGAGGLYYYTLVPSPAGNTTVASSTSAGSSTTSNTGGTAPASGYIDSQGQPQGAWANYLGYIPSGYTLAPHYPNANTYPCPSGMNPQQCTQFKASCGNGVCDPNESCSTCPIDCGVAGQLTCDPYTGRPGAPISICQMPVANG